MGMRKYQRQIAKARMRALGIGNINKKMGTRSDDGRRNWIRAMTGDSGKAAEKAQVAVGRAIAKPKKPKRKLWKVSA